MSSTPYVAGEGNRRVKLGGLWAKQSYRPFQAIHPTAKNLPQHKGSSEENRGTKSNPTSKMASHASLWRWPLGRVTSQRGLVQHRSTGALSLPDCHER